MKVRRSREDDALFMAPFLRDADVQEIEAWGHDFENYAEALKAAVLSADDALTLVHEDRPVAIAGVHSDTERPGVGWIWMLGTDEIEQHQIAFCRFCKERLPFLENGFESVVAFTDARNKIHHRWLEFMGFDFLNTVEINGHRFHEVVKCVTPSRSDSRPAAQD